MKKILLLLAFSISLINVSAQNFGWASVAGGASGDIGQCITKDASGNVYAAGIFKSNTMVFGSYTLVNADTSSLFEDIYIVKYASDGTVVWAKSIGGSGTDFVEGICLDNAGNIIISGSFNSTSIIMGLDTLIDFGGHDAYVAKLDASGNVLWGKQLVCNGDDYARAVTTDNSGNIYATGSFRFTSDFDPSAGTFSLITSGGSDDIFIWQLDANGAFVWAKQIGDTAQDVGRSIIIDAQGFICSTGYFQGTVDFDPGAGLVTKSSVGDYDAYVLKLDNTGAFHWVKTFGGTLQDFSLSIKADAQNNLYTTGGYTGNVDFDPNAGTSYSNSFAGSQDVFISKIDAFGNYVWSKGFGGVFDDRGCSMDLDNSGNVYVTGYFKDTLLYPSSAINLISHGSDDIFVTKTDSLGSLIWANSFGSNYPDNGSGIVVDAVQNVYTTGYFYSTVDFDPSAAVANFSSNGGSDAAFILKLSQGGQAPNAGFAISSPVNTNMSCFGTQLTFNDTSSNTPTSWSWNFGDGQTSTMQNPIHTYSVAGNYNIALVATNAAGGDTAFFNLNVNALPNVVISGGSPINICVGSSSNINASGANTYTWTPSIGLSSTTGPSVIASPTSTIQYTVTGTSSAGCTASDSVLVNVVQAPIANFSYSDTCANVSINFTDNSTAGGGSIVSWMWDFGDGATSTLTNPTHAYATAGIYNVQLNVSTNNGCNGFASNNIAIDSCASPIVVTSPNGGEFWMQGTSNPVTWNFGSTNMVIVEYSIDAGTTWNFIATYSGTSNLVNWSLPTTPSGTCLIKVHDNANPSNFDISDAFFTITSPPSASATHTNVTCNGVCNGTASANVTGGVGPYTYLWSPGGMTTQTINGLCAGTYGLTVTDSLNATANFNVTINQPNVLSVSINGTNTICLGSSTTLSTTASGGTPGYSFNWNPISSTAASVSVSPAVTTMYYVTVSDNNGCTANSNYNVTVNSLPAVTAVPSVNTICIGSGQTVTLSATGASTYSWSSGSNGPVANVNPVTTTTYSVVGTDANSCSDTAFVAVNVNPIQSLYSGSVFFKDNGTPINVTSGKVYIYNVDSVGWIGATDSATIGAGGSFNMGTVPFGNYKVYITPNQTTFPFLANTYYNMEYTWDSAAVVSFTCADTTYMQIELDSISPLPTVGGVTVGGVIIADSTFTGKVAVQGDPIPGVDVALEQNPGSIMLATTTTNSNGHYTFNNIPLTPSGYHYTIIANIPGFGLDSSYNVVVTSAETDLNYFVSDSTIYIDSAMSATYAGVKHIDKINETTDFKVYPNPYKNGTNINFELKEKSVVQLEIYNALGEKVAVLENTTKETGTYKYSFSAKAIGYSTGIYFAKLRINNSLSVAKLMEVE